GDVCFTLQRRRRQVEIEAKGKFGNAVVLAKLVLGPAGALDVAGLNVEVAELFERRLIIFAGVIDLLDQFEVVLAARRRWGQTRCLREKKCGRSRAEKACDEPA